MNHHKTPSAEPISLDHAPIGLVHLFGSNIGRVILATNGKGLEGAIAVTARAFPGNTQILRVCGIGPRIDALRYDPSDIAAVTKMAKGLDAFRRSDGRSYAGVANVGMIGSPDEGSLADHVGGEIMHQALDRRHGRCGTVLVTRRENLPEPYNRQVGSTALALCLTGAYLEAPDQVGLQWHQLYTQGA